MCSESARYCWVEDLPDDADRRRVSSNVCVCIYLAVHIPQLIAIVSRMSDLAHLGTLIALRFTLVV